MAISIVVPAHNEASAIGRCLEALMPPGCDGALELVVVCNGCTDDTEHVATAHGSGVVVDVLPEASKIAALNRGDELATGYPRFYVDADVRISRDGISALAAHLERDGADLVAPGLSYDVADSSRPVRSYYRIWTCLPSVRNEPVGRGVYGLSRAGRAAFGRFPDVLADDHFVRDLFPPHRRLVVPEVVSSVRAPRTLRDLIRRKVRVYAGIRVLDRSTGSARRRGAERQRQWVGVVWREPALLRDVPVYVVASVVPRLLIGWHRLRGRTIGWGRDESSRREP